MTKIHHINCGTLIVPGYPTVVCHCLLLEDKNGLALVDTGIGMHDVRSPTDRLGQELIELAGFQFHENDTAVRRIEELGFSVADVKHIVLTHCDPDHTGGLADFPQARVHVANEEWEHAQSGHFRSVSTHFEHGPLWQRYEKPDATWFEFEVRRVDLNFSSEVLLIPLFGHTLGHCGVAIQQDERWLLHVGDAYYLRAELTETDHPVSAFAAQRADDDQARIASLAKLQTLHQNHSDRIDMVGYHDLHELPDTTMYGN